MKNGNGVKIDYQTLKFKNFSFSLNGELFSYKTYRETYRVNFFNLGTGYSFHLVEKNNYRIDYFLNTGLSLIEKRDYDYVERGFCEFLSSSIKFFYNFFELYWGISLGYSREKILYGKDNFTFDLSILFTQF
ncbi:MAG: hypothetical protein ABIN00_00810 [candidate division WOR-3 bacterium]